MFINCHCCSYPSGVSIDHAEMVKILFLSPFEFQVGVRESHKQSTCDLTLSPYSEGCVCHRHWPSTAAVG